MDTMVPGTEGIDAEEMVEAEKSSNTQKKSKTKNTSQRRLKKKSQTPLNCREALIMQMLQKALEALETIDISTLSATNIVHLVEIAARLLKITEEKNPLDAENGEAEPVKIYLPDNQRDGMEAVTLDPGGRR